ncbi:MAG TPA: site-2 protease family protein [Candidatus Elarobacter sp.]|jgi:Zn-dependent protease|nr:site-2 protease family protein [Candidatus Elarobacter sp.]
MHDDERLQQPKTTGSGKRGAVGSVLVALGLAAAKFKALLAGLLTLKWLLIGPKILFSFGSMFISVWLYAVWFGGWKIAVVFVLMILVHELGHFVTWRNFGVKASLPMFIPGFGAFVSAPATGTPLQSVTAALAGPVFGVAAAAVCWAFAAQHGEAALAPQARFWTGCAYIGFFINLFNLIPTPPFDGGAVAGAIDARLWIVGVVLLTVFVLLFAHTTFGFVILLLMVLTAVPRVIAIWRGQLDPRASGLTSGQRVGTLVAYLAVVGVALAGAAATLVERQA